jgi:hypothetical protein
VSDAAPPAEGPPRWADSVEVREDPELARELAERLAVGSNVRGVGVTDLLAPRRAFWRRVGPPPTVEAEQRARRETGVALHRWLAPVFAGEGRLEVRVRRDGVAGRIDVLSDVPIEIKTSAVLVAPDELRRSRPEHLEQLGMYCALVERPSGRLVTWIVPGGPEGTVATADVAFRDLGAVRSEMLGRAAALRAAWSEDRSDSLPRCPWFGRGCEFQTSRICDCTGHEAPASDAILAAVDAVAARPDLDVELARRRAALLPRAEPTAVERFRDLVYPRRAYFEGAPESAERVSRATRPVTPDLFSRLLEAIESGPIGEVATLPSRTEEPGEEVAAFRDAPYLVRTSRAWDRVPVDRWVARFPQYALELGFRCAVTGTAEGRVVLGYERAESDRDRLQVVEYRFRQITPIARLCRERLEALRRARDRGDPYSLPPCPSWMFDDCPFRDRCACAGTRSAPAP